MRKIITVDPNIRAKRTDLIDPPVIVRVNKTFNEEMAQQFAEDMSHAHETGQPVIPIIVDSYGGSVYTLLEMISVIQSAKLPVATIVEGKAMSAGAILFGFGNERYMSENATLMLHDVASFSAGKVEEIKADAKELERLQNLIFTMLAKQLGKKPNYFLDALHEKGHAEWFLTPKEAKKHGLCTHISVPELKAEIKVNYTFN